MTKSELIEILSRKRSDILYKDVEQAVKTLLELSLIHILYPI